MSKEEKMKQDKMGNIMKNLDNISFHQHVTDQSYEKLFMQISVISAIFAYSLPLEGFGWIITKWITGIFLVFVTFAFISGIFKALFGNKIDKKEMDDMLNPDNYKKV